MITLLLCGLIAGACAAPQFDHDWHPHRPHHRPYGPPSFFPNYHLRSSGLEDGNIFDTGRFWADLNKELKELDVMLNEFTRQFPASSGSEGIEGTEYKITISLPDFEEKDIVVKAREGLLMIQANHKYTGGSERNYLDLRNLPDSVNVTGNWIFEKGVLKITFPLKEGTNIPVLSETTTDKDVTVRPTFAASREEMETERNENESDQDADIGLGRGDQGKQNELNTNQIPDRELAVEATTYAVDLKDEVEFVPVRY